MTLCSCPNKHSSWWRRTEDVFSVTFFCLPRRLQDVLKTLFQDVMQTRLEDVLKTSWRRFRKRHCIFILKTSWRRLQKVLEDEKCYAEDVLKISWITRNICWVWFCNITWQNEINLFPRPQCLWPHYLTEW